MSVENLRNIERLNYVLSVVLAIGAFLLLSRPWAGGSQSAPV